MQSCIPLMIWWWCGGSATSYSDEVLGSTPQTWLNGLALSHVSHLTLSGAPKILLYCTEYRRTTTHIQSYLGCLRANFVIWVCKNGPFCLCRCWLSTGMVAKVAPTHKTQPQTHTQHTTINMSSRHCPIQRLCSLSMDRAVGAPNHCDLAPYGFVAGVQRWVCARNGWFPCLG